MKNLRLVFNDAKGQRQDITLPMEKWIRDWWYECKFVPENGEVPEIAELDGEDILKDFPGYANSFEDIAYKYMRDGIHDDFYGDVRAGKIKDNGDAFEQWLRDNVDEEKLYSYAMKELRYCMYKYIDKFCIEICPGCGSEQVIFTKGITRCSDCGYPIAPCSQCESCNYSYCPYGCDGTENDLKKKVTNRNITKEEAAFLYKNL